MDEHIYGMEYPAPRGAITGGHTAHLTRTSRLIDDSDLLYERDSLRAGRYNSGLAGRIDSRDLPSSAPITRRGPPVIDRDEYSPHRGGGSSRRMLNAM